MADCTLSMDNLCVKCGRICWLKSKYITVEDLNLNNLCAQKVNSKEINGDQGSFSKLCVQEAVINKLCVNELNSSSLKVCNKYRFFAGFSSDFSYTLGSPINFNSIVDDPNANVSLSPNTNYVAPVAGYYTSSLFINGSALSGSSVITGIPVARLMIKVNGLPRVDTMVPFLSFALTQQATFSAHLYLAAGDVVTTSYDLLVLDGLTGIIPYVGTINFKGGSATSDGSTWSMVLLTELCGGGGSTPVACAPCQPSLVTCEPVPASTDCVPPTPPPAAPCTFDCR